MADELSYWKTAGSSSKRKKITSFYPCVGCAPRLSARTDLISHISWRHIRKSEIKNLLYVNDSNVIKKVTNEEDVENLQKI